jgi:hypothetical protein
MAMINAVLYKRRSFCGSDENPVSADRETGEIVRQTEHERNCIDDNTPEILNASMTGRVEAARIISPRQSNNAKRLLSSQSTSQATEEPADPRSESAVLRSIKRSPPLLQRTQG